MEVSLLTNLLDDDKSDLIYISQKGKFDAVVEDVVEKHKQGQPVLLGTVAVETSEYISNLLKSVVLDTMY